MYLSMTRRNVFREAVVVVSTESGLEVNVDKTQYMVMSGDQNAGRTYRIKTDNT